jgi:hypothetical protein
MTFEKIQTLKRTFLYFVWKDSLASNMERARRVGSVGKIGYIRTNPSLYFEEVQLTLNDPEKLIEYGKEKGWDIDYAVWTTEKRLRSLLNQSGSKKYLSHACMQTISMSQNGLAPSQNATTNFSQKDGLKKFKKGSKKGQINMSQSGIFISQNMPKMSVSVRHVVEVKNLKKQTTSFRMKGIPKNSEKR